MAHTVIEGKVVHGIRARRGLMALLFAWLVVCPGLGAAECLDPLGDITGDSLTNVVDVQCAILTTLWTLSGDGVETSPSCAQGQPERADLTCTDGVNVTDVVLTIQLALGSGVSQSLDADGSGCPDACEGGPAEPFCGDGQVDPGEDCDEGVDNSDVLADSCRTDCTEPTCGDGVVDTDEECDGSANCSSECTIDEIPDECGNGIEDPGEECDEGDDNSDVLPDACRTDCTIPGCGDGVIDSDEECDDAAQNSDTQPDACRTNCSFPYCGDGVQDSSEACDDGGLNSDTLANACRTTCEIAGCGDGVVDTGEACDDGEDNSDQLPDACRTDCSSAGCGDGVVDAGEECDGTPGCAVTCVVENGFCGDGVVQSGEACDGTSDCAEDCTFLDSVVPTPGDLVITEIMAAGNGGGEWFEVMNTTALVLDLATMTVRDDGGDFFVVVGEEALLSPGQSYVFGNATADADSEIPVDWAYTNFTLDEAEDEVVLEMVGQELDRVNYGSNTGFEVVPGASLSLDADQVSIVDNDAPDSWCAAGSPLGAGSFGTPGTQNPYCPICGNGLLEPGEECDTELLSPGQECGPNCEFVEEAVCGDGIVGENEECDDGELNSDLEPDACRESCFLPYCGDLVVDTGEDCDALFGCTEECATPLPGAVSPGDLVITEIMPEGLLLEGTGHWIEVLNVTNEAIALEGLIIHDDSGEFFELFQEPSPVIESGQFLVLGTNTDPETNGGVVVDVDVSGLDLDVEADTVVLVVDVEIDRVEYDTGALFNLLEGASLTLSATQLNTTANDVGVSWCPSLLEYGVGGNGTPGQPNEECPICGDGILEGVEVCDDGAANSDTSPDACRTSCVPASCGDDVVDSNEECDGTPGCTLSCGLLEDVTGVLVISEVMAEPGFADDANGEWFEIYNASEESLDLNGMVLRDEGGEEHVVSDPEGVVIDPGAYVVFGINDALEINGGLVVDYVYDDFGLASEGDQIILELGGEEVDRFEWDASYAVSAGKSLNLDPIYLSFDTNDASFAWCPGLVLFGSGDLGTPGQPNVSCPNCGNGIFELGEQCDQGTANSDTEPDSCRTDCTLPGCGDSVLDSGEECDLVDPLVCSSECLFLINVKPGDLVVTEIMNNPSAVSDSQGEWVEVLNVTDSELDLNGLWLVDDGTDFYVIESDTPLLLAAGERMVLGPNGDVGTNGGLVLGYEYDGAQFSLSNGFDEVVLSSLGVEVDRVAYDDGQTFPDTAGASMNLEPFIFDAFNNDEGTFWCVSSSPYGAGDKGTPGVENDTCPICGNNIQEPGEECDDGNLSGGDGCELDCTVTVFEVCGNSILEPGEECDDGVGNSDTLPDACRSSCLFAYCGDGVVDTGEACDGGPTCTATCTVEGVLEAGALVVSEIMLFPQIGNPQDGTWFELYNTTGAAVALNGVVLSDNEGDLHVIAAVGLVVAPQGYVVLAANGEVASNGGLTPDYVFDGSEFGLDGDADEIVITAGGTELDRVEYSAFMGFPQPMGASMILNSAFLDAFINDFGSVWCTSFTTYGAGGAGTPGALNDPCPVCGDAVVQPGEECDDGNAFFGDGCDSQCFLEGSLPGLGDLVITELMVDPKLSEDEDGEWFELKNVTEDPLNLYGLVLKDGLGGEHSSSTVLLLAPGESAVFGNNVSLSANGGVELDHEYDSLSFGNAEGVLSVERDGGLIDEMTWGAGSPLVPGAALSLHPPLTDAVSNDVLSNWCSSSGVLANGDFGTPGEDNPPCPF